MKIIKSLYHSWVRYAVFFILLPMMITLYILYRTDNNVVAFRYGLKNPITLIPSMWTAQGDKTVSDYAIAVVPANLKRFNTIVVTYNTNGLCLLNGRASNIAFERPKTQSSYEVSLANYGKNCFDGLQTVEIPMSDFGNPTDVMMSTRFHVSFWHQSQYSVDIKQVSLKKTSITKNKNIAKRIPKPQRRNEQQKESTPSGTVASAKTDRKSPPGRLWEIRSVSSMKETKDKLCNQDSEEFIESWITKAASTGANFVSIETPYDRPECGDTIEYTNRWVQTARNHNLSIWHRHMPLAFEGIYSVEKKSDSDYLELIAKYIKEHAGLFKTGDIFTPIPEPQNGGIRGVTYCPHDVCQFENAEEFNMWLRNSIEVSKKAFEEVGLGGKINIGFFGFDGFVAWGDNNPDWEGILEDETIAAMGNITIDHYPEIVDDTMANDLDELQAKYPGVPIVIGEWGTITEDNPIEQVKKTMSAAARPGVIGFNYWHLGMGGNEALLNSDMSEKKHFSTVRSFFSRETNL